MHANSSERSTGHMIGICLKSRREPRPKTDAYGQTLGGAVQVQCLGRARHRKRIIKAFESTKKEDLRGFSMI